SGPAIPIPLMPTADRLWLVKGPVWAALVVQTICGGNVSLLGERLTTVPVPESEICCWEPLMSSLLSPIVMTPVRVPISAGLNVMLITQLLPGERLAGQLLVCAKSPVLVT